MLGFAGSSQLRAAHAMGYSDQWAREIIAKVVDHMEQVT